MKWTERQVDEAGYEYDAFTPQCNLVIVIVCALLIAALVSVPVLIRPHVDKIDKQIEAIFIGR